MRESASRGESPAANAKGVNEPRVVCVGRIDDSSFFEMSTSTLRFSGPAHQARIQLVQLLKAFPQVTFQERAATEYGVSAPDEAALKKLAGIPGWSLTGLR